MKQTILTKGITVICLVLINQSTAGAQTPCMHLNGCAGVTLPSVPLSDGICTAPRKWYCYSDSKGNIKGPYLTCETSCINGYSLQNDPQWESDMSGCGSFSDTPQKCVSNASLCGKCDSDAWSEIPSIPYARRTKRYCEGTKCKEESEIGCKKGFYGKPTQIGSGCTQCPKSGNTSGTTAAIGARDITECYLPADTAFNDTSGNGKYTDKCHYNS